jgi:hypothetical protein
MRAVKQLVYRGIAVRVEASDVADLDWLAEFLTPSFAVAATDTADCTVMLVADERRHREILAATGAAGNASVLDCFVLDRGVISLPSWPAADGGRIIVNSSSGLLYVVSADRRRTELVTAPENRKRRGELMRVVREFAMAAAWTRHSLVLHAAAFAIGNRAVLIAGPKHAGKTSLLMSCLHASGARFVSNDRVVVDLANSEPHARGMPTIVSIRSDTLDRFPAAMQRLGSHEYHYARTIAEAEVQKATASTTGSLRRALSLSSAQLCRLFGVEMVGSAVPAAIVFPQVDAGIRDMVVRELEGDEAMERLPDALLGASIAPRTSEVFALSGAAPAIGYPEVTRVWRTLLAHVRAFDCRLGPDAYAPDLRARLIAQVLKGSWE